MENVVAKLLQDFEKGKMDRRQLIRTLAAVALAGPAVAALDPRAAAAAAPRVAPWQTNHLGHISYQVTDHVRSAEWYADLMGWRVINQEDNQTTMAIGDVGEIIVRNRRNPAPAGQVASQIDHISFGVTPWDKDAVKEELTRRGLSPRDDFQGGGFESYHVKDPDGWDLQISNETEVSG
jgi:hypothetical protein